MDSYLVLLTPQIDPGPGGTRREVPAPVLLGRDAPALVVDVLRATTTLTVAMRNGAARVLEAATPEEGFALQARHPGALLCGEREGLRIPGYDLGNSPFEYVPERVAGKTLVFASTNGSQALRLAARQRERVLACFANLSAAVERVRAARRVVVVCAGKLGRFALEDAACAGAIARRLRALGGEPLNPAASLVERLAPEGEGEVRALVQGSSHGRYLRRLGDLFARDVDFCARLDAIDQAYAV